LVDPDPHIPSAEDAAAFGDDLAREVYCILGVPVDVVGLSRAMLTIETAARQPKTLFLSTPNLNFFNMSWRDAEFRRSLLVSDLCLPDGMPVLWMGRLLGVPIRERLAGADILAAMRRRSAARDPLRLFFFGGDDGVAEAAANAFNGPDSGSRCVGWLNPGFRPIEEMSGAATIDAINDSRADFVVVALGAKKGQAWLMRNAERLRVPVRAHFGASLNFEAGRLRRAPELLQRFGLEWVWRIKEEPYLWRRYFADGVALLYVLAANVAPIVIHDWLNSGQTRAVFGIDKASDPSGAVTIALSGPATSAHADRLISGFEDALSAVGTITIDMSGVTRIDARLLGLLVVYRRKVANAKLRLLFVGLSESLLRQIRLHKSEFLFIPETEPNPAPSSEANRPKALSSAPLV
jgi:N-acetylglucosaminyldiphosphoundecaprenol N-acetyl-beta-D-mannosaminyltransferase